MNSVSYKSVRLDQDEIVVREYTPLVKKIARHLLCRLPCIIQMEDLVQTGMIGLIEAARNFDQEKGAAFVTYAGIRIRGAMLDEIRKGDWAPRSVHKNARRVAQAIREIENATGQVARDVEVARVLEMSLDEYHKIVQDTSSTKVFALNDLGVNEESGSFGCPISYTPLEKLQREDFRKRLEKELNKLPHREKLVLSLYYDEELNLREVGDVLGVSESRISQIHSQAMFKLKSKLTDWE